MEWAFYSLLTQQLEIHAIWLYNHNLVAVVQAPRLLDRAI